MAMFGSKKQSSGSLEAGGTAAQKLAVESFKNIANTEIGALVQGPAAAEDPEVDAIAELLKGASVPVAVAEVAERLGWDSGRAADALSRGATSGRLTFMSSQGRTFVGLPARPAGGSDAP